jgi:CheY-like chemotaxis protein
MKKLSGILLIDDDETTNFLNERLLLKMNLTDRIRIFKNGKQAFDYLYNVSNHNYDSNLQDYFQPELIFLDINMPVMDGFEFLDLYNRLNSEFRKNILLVVLTTSSHTEDTIRAEKYAAHYVTKPLNAGKITKILAANLANNDSV